MVDLHAFSADRVHIPTQTGGNVPALRWLKWLLTASFVVVWAEMSVELAIAATPADGYRILRTKSYLPPDFDEATFRELWTVWPEPERSRAEKADESRRRQLMMEYYGLVADPEKPAGPALGYVAGPQGTWVMSCLACHAGTIAGQTVPGMGNSHFALQSLTEDVRKIKLKQRKTPGHLESAALTIPLNTTNGSTNSVVFGIVLGAYRRPDMSVDLKRRLPPLTHHDVDAPPFWNVKKKRSLYADGFSPKTARPLMQFILLPKTGPEQLQAWEPDFERILEWIESVEAPKYPYAINQPLADRGEAVFNEHCARCHGTYGAKGRYEQQLIPWDEVRTDPVRLRALTPEHRQWMRDGWLSRYGKDPVDVNPDGYVAPPLDGIWASGPYFHNGSVPTLWHVLHPSERPVVWKRTRDGYDRDRVGLEVEMLESVPDEVEEMALRRRYFDTTLPGKSAAGHDFPELLTEEQKRAVLEYLKRL